LSTSSTGSTEPKGFSHLEMTITDEALQRILLLSQGLPHYTHLIALHASRAALDRRSLEIAMQDIDEAIDLLSCALAEADELGYFAAQHVRTPMREITGKKYEIPSFSQHLNDFTDKRGPILQRIGTKRKFRFRFLNPLMQPYVIMRGINERRLPQAMLAKLVRTTTAATNGSKGGGRKTMPAG